MKDYVKELWKMAGVWVITLLWDVGFVFAMITIIRDGRNLLLTIIESMIFIFLTALWNFVVVDCTIQGIQRYRIEKQKEKNDEALD